MVKKRLRARRRRRAGGAGGALLMAFGMLAVFVAVALMQRGGIPGVRPHATPAPTSAITPVSDTVRMGARDFYAIQFGVYENAAAAQEKALEYVDRGAAGYVWKETGAMRVLGAVYETLSDAQTIKERLGGQGIDVYIYTLHLDALELRIDAGEAQRALLAKVFAFIPRALSEIGDASIAMDKRTMTAQEAAERFYLLSGEAETLLDNIRAVLGEDEAGIVARIQALLAQIMSDCADIFSQNSQEELAMAAKIKYNYLDVLWNIHRFVREVLALSDA